MSAAVHANEIIKTYGSPTLPGWEIKSPRSARGMPQPVKALDRVSFSVPEGEIFGLVGGTGAGKTTLIRMLAALLRPDGGDLRVFGYDVVRQRAQVQRLINPVSVEASFFKGLSPLDNLLHSAGPYRLAAGEVRSQAFDLLTRLGLEDAVSFRSMEDLSRAQQQLVFIARAVLSCPRLLLLDEPFAGLDLFARYRVREVLHDLRERHGVTILVATREQMDAENLSDRYAVLCQGSLVSIETPAAVGFSAWPAVDCRSMALDGMSV